MKGMPRMKRLLSLLLLPALLAGCAHTGGESEALDLSPQAHPEAAAVPEQENNSSSAEIEHTQALSIPDGMSAVFVQRGTDGADDGVTQLLDRMEQHGRPFYRTDKDPQGIVGKNDVVLLKIRVNHFFCGI